MPVEKDGVGLELTDAFEELQAFFEGGTLLDGPSGGRMPTSSTKVSAVSEGLRWGVRARVFGYRHFMCVRIYVLYVAPAALFMLFPCLPLAEILRV